ncbi:ABC transporter substrate-binding protein [Xylanimonas ulmi]|uniref:Carbohydrate ABC transporter substrate-binding protein (CUT1 family) n=1 Tax=Xylanimonas ulmi TaxID=228973 RepID=A0A4Q7M793_9MICO|nr:ABC transporter substrate-binding protein [Xylanibacterium ulmi]RZS62967.1 carbohydrate ABC transporter substrate-binding protein (CUT1 family) [Xylanibacterium ulmi]
MKRPRPSLVAAAAVIASLALTACSGPSVASGSDDASGAPAAAAGGPDFDGVTPAKKITFWSSNPGGSGDVTQEIIDAFTAQTGIEVELVPAANYEDVAQKFQAAQAGGSLPDVLTLSDVWWFRYYLNDQIIPLGDALQAAEVDTDDYLPVFYGDYQYAGEQWAVPFARSTPLFYYNKAQWEAAGLPDRGPQTWQEFAEWAPKLAAVNGGKPAFEWPDIAGYAGWIAQDLLWGWGGSWSAKDSFDITADSDASVEALQFLQDSIDKEGWAAQAAKDAGADLAAGGTSATIASSGSFAGIQKTLDSAGNPFELGAAPLPGGPAATTGVSPTGGTGVAIPKGIPVENQLAAAEFIAFLTNPENTVKFSAATGYIPVDTSADTTALRKAAPIIGVAIDQAGQTRSQDWARVFLPGGDQAMNAAIQSIATQKAPVKDTMADLRSTLEQIYSSQVEPHLK